MTKKYESNALFLTEEQLAVLRQYRDGCVELSDLCSYLAKADITVARIEPAVGTGGDLLMRLRRGELICSYQYDPEMAQVGF